MLHQRTQKSSASHPQTQQQSSQFAPRPFAIQAQPETQKPATQEEIENEAFNQNKFEANGLQLKEKSGTIAPEEQERLGVLQAKMNDLMVQRQERTSRNGFNLIGIPIHSPDATGNAPIQTKLGQKSDREGEQQQSPQESSETASNEGMDLVQRTFQKTNPQSHPVSPIQAKLTIGQPGDKYEQEADSVAAKVVEQINAPASGQSTQGQSVQRQEEDQEEEVQAKPEISALQRMEEPKEEDIQAKLIQKQGDAIGGGEASTDLDTAINSARGGGQPLDAGLQRTMGQAMGADFSGVRVHTDSQSDQLNRSVQAKAFTTGQDVFFRQGEYNPGSRGGQELIAHELTHVVQQSGGAVQRSQPLDGRIYQRQTGLSPMVQCKPKIKSPGRRVGIDLDLLPDDEVEGLIQYLNNETNAPKFTIDFDNENPATLLERAKKKLQSRQQVTGKFNVRGRAVNSGEGFVFSDDNEIRKVAEANGLWAYPTDNEASVRQTYPQSFQGLSLLIDQPNLANTKFYGKQTDLRGARDQVAQMKGNETILYSASDTVQSSITLTEPCRRGDESKKRDAAMGGLSALNYAKAVGINGAEKHTWEWLHLVGSAIGGGNSLGNLVAGTYDMNTLMIPLEQTIVEYSNRPDISVNNPMIVTAKAKLFANDKGQPTWVAETITLEVQHGGKSFWLGPITQNINMLTTMEFDFYRYVFQRMAGND
jgi:hypothetical protein